jgi:hypothetical protein
MKIPKYKPTKWKLKYCMDCNVINPGWTHRNHNIVERPNTPFFVPDMKFVHVASKWSLLRSEKMSQTFSISASKLHEIVTGCGVKSGGFIPNQWWMWAKVGGSVTIKWLPT